MELVFTFEAGRNESYEIFPGDTMRYERQFRGESISDLVPPRDPEDQTKPDPAWRPPGGYQERIMYLGFCAARRMKLTELDFDEWADTIVTFGAEDDAPLVPSNGESHSLPPLPGSPSES